MSKSTKGLKAVASLEACKGVLSLLVGLGLHVLAGKNLEHVAVSLVHHAHLNPASHYPSIFIHAMTQVSDGKIKLLAFGALVYALIRFVEAYGLWKALVWTEWFALVSGAIYLPFELYEMVTKPSLLGVGVFVINIVVVAYMASLIFGKHHLQETDKASSE
ncbi:DUF2127 domain-containing protein [Vibrio porteresiae]|uniref:DUF2127 domain-containing protein n=1 Tax=Vibrio porteresiae DSM 19223 TaxID=1123496 RepID=A0ABZ0Q7K7_9VIBR|nr:DUF2127 domain-containing protein [Vibrio porteresiae]WPC72416.1 DUF2127 domain-containing protein [Vibrio porteresiae DSM 19223]